MPWEQHRSIYRSHITHECSLDSAANRKFSSRASLPSVQISVFRAASLEICLLSKAPVTMLSGCRVYSVVILFLSILFPSFSLSSARPGRLDKQTRATTSPLIISLKDGRSLDRLEKLCNGELADWKIPDFKDSAKKCRLFSGACHRVFRQSILGVSGDFTADEVELIERCIPDGVAYVESDAQVIKAEGPRPNSHDDGRRRLPPVNNEDAFPTVHVKRRMLQRESPQGMTVDSSLASIVGSPGEKSQDLHVALWNLDRIDQHELPLDKTYRYGTSNTVGTGDGVNVYILDSGVNPSHREFLKWKEKGSRASYGYDFVDEDDDAEDCDGHGTHVASTVIGRSVGIAKQASIISVRVLDCEGSGNISTTVAGLDWVAANYKKPAVIALSLGVSIGRWSQSIEDSVKTLINEHEIPVVVASGNSAVDSCYIAPANVPETITVAASDLDSKFETTKRSDKESVYRWSNTGSCVDLFAPGVDIYAACGGATRCDAVTDEAYTWASGTSMAVPHVAGVAAVYLGDYPNMTPYQLKEELIEKSIKTKIVSEFMRPETPNRLLYSHGTETIVVATDGP